MGACGKPRSGYKKRGRMDGGKVAKSKKQEKRSRAKAPPPFFLESSSYLDLAGVGQAVLFCKA